VLGYQETKNIKYIPEFEEWLEAMKEKNKALRMRESYLLVPRTEKMIVIPSRWVLSTKISPTTTKKKARFVIKGCSQVPGRDFDTTYAPTLSRKTLSIVLVIKLERNMKIKQMDVRSAFLYG
jgi:Reverse transcriptase (RNA-dependent DNA polymerase)